MRRYNRWPLWLLGFFALFWPLGEWNGAAAGLAEAGWLIFLAFAGLLIAGARNNRKPKALPGPAAPALPAPPMAWRSAPRHAQVVTVAGDYELTSPNDPDVAAAWVTEHVPGAEPVSVEQVAGPGPDPAYRVTYTLPEPAPRPVTPVTAPRARRWGEIPHPREQVPEYQHPRTPAGPRPQYQPPRNHTVYINTPHRPKREAP
jgi:hypothetical protein